MRPADADDFRISAVILTATNITNGYVDITPSVLAPGSYVFNAKITDVAGNTSATSGSFTMTIDTTVATPSG